MLRRKKSNGSGASGELELLFLGLEGAGKTLLIRRLKHHTLLAASSKQRKKAKEAISFSTDVVPTIGVNVDEVKLQRKSVKLREVGGAMKPLWPTYFKACSALLFCVDMSDENTLVASSVEFMKLVTSEALRSKPIYVILNKLDAPLRLTTAEIENAFQFEQLKGTQTRVRAFVASAYTGEGLQDLVDSLGSTI